MEFENAKNCELSSSLIEKVTENSDYNIMVLGDYLDYLIEQLIESDTHDDVENNADEYATATAFKEYLNANGVSEWDVLVDFNDFNFVELTQDDILDYLD